MGGNKKVKAYVPVNLENFGKSIILIRHERDGGENVFEFKVNLEGLQKAVQTLPKDDRETVEKFWGLTGGPNHSKKLVNPNMKDTAFFQMRNKAIISLRKLLTLDYMIMYDENLTKLIDEVCKKVNKKGIDIPNMEIVKYLMAFSIYIDNGPKMCFEKEPMSIDSSLDDALLIDEYEVLKQISEEIDEYQDESINLRLLMGFFEMVDVRDMLIMKKSIGIKMTDFNSKDIETVKSVLSIRNFKERLFPYGAWDVTSMLIVGDIKGINFDSFKDALNENSVDWIEKIETFKTNETKTLKTSKGIRTLSVYRVGELEFTDPHEVDFLYLYAEA